MTPHQKHRAFDMSETILGLFCFLLILAALAGLLFLLAQLPSGDPEDANAIMRLLDSVSSGV